MGYERKRVHSFPSWREGERGEGPSIPSENLSSKRTRFLTKGKKKKMIALHSTQGRGKILILTRKMKRPLFRISSRRGKNFYLGKKKRPSPIYGGAGKGNASSRGRLPQNCSEKENSPEGTSDYGRRGDPKPFTEEGEALKGGRRPR